MQNGTETGGLTKIGSGNLTLAGNNTYTGTTAINVGTLQANNAGALGNGGNITFGGGTLQFTSASAGQDWGARLKGSGSAIALNLNGQSVTFNGAIDSSNTAGLTVGGTGNLTLGGGNAYTGTTALNGGTLQANNATALGAGGNITFGGGTLQFTAASAGQDWGARIKGSGSAIALDLNGQSVTFNGTIDGSNTAGLTVGGAGNLTLGGSNAYTGNTTISTGTLALSGSLGGGDYAGNIANSGTFSHTSSGSQTLSGTISGNGSLAQAGSGTLTLNATNTYTGTTTVSAGTLALGNTLAVQSSTLDTGSAGSQSVTFTVAGANTYTLGGLQGSHDLDIGNNTISVGSNNATTTFSGGISGAGGGLTKSGSGTLILSGSSTYTGATTLANGTLRLTGGNDRLTSGTDLIFSGSGGGLDLTTTTQTIGNLTVSSTGYTISNGTISTTNKTWTTNQNTTISSNLAIDTSAGEWIKSGTKDLTLSGTVTQTGANRFNINTAGKVFFTGNSTLAGALRYIGNAEFDAGTHTMASFAGGAGASFIVNGANVTSTGNAFVGSGSTASLTVNSGSLTVNGSINAGQGAGSGTVNLNGGVLAATQIYATANSSYTQKLIIKGGTFKALANQSTNLFVFSTGNATIGTGGATIDTNGFNVTQTQALLQNGSETGGLTKIGSGTLTLAGNNTYTGATTVNAGTLAFIAGNASATGVQSLGKNATLTLGVASTSSGILNYTGSGAVTLAKNINALGNGADTIQNSGSGLLTLAGNLAKNGTVLTLKGGGNGIDVTGAITGSDAGSDLIVDGGNTTLSAANSYNGPTSLINGATLTANATNALPTANGRTAISMDQTGSGSSALVLGGSFSQSVASLAGNTTSAVNLNANTPGTSVAP